MYDIVNDVVTEHQHNTDLSNLQANLYVFSLSNINLQMKNEVIQNSTINYKLLE